MDAPDIKKLTLKQRLWLKEYISTGNATEAARRAGYQCENEQSFRQIGYENLTKLDTSELMEEMGLSNANLIKILAQGLFRPVKRFVKRIVTANTANSQIKEFVYEDTPDWNIRHKYLVTALKLKGYLGPDHIVQNQLNIGEYKIEVVNYSASKRE